MLTIRPEQIEVFTGLMRKRFEDRMRARLGERFPEKCKALGEEAVRASIRDGIDRAAAYGVNIEADVARYIELMYRFSPDFDTGPALPWAAEILKNPRLGSHPKMDQLCARADQETSPSASTDSGRR